MGCKRGKTLSEEILFFGIDIFIIQYLRVQEQFSKQAQRSTAPPLVSVIVQPKPKPKQSKDKGWVSPIKVILDSGLSLSLSGLKLAVYSARAQNFPIPQSKHT